jgi:hypothetical protein
MLAARAGLVSRLPLMHRTLTFRLSPGRGGGPRLYLHPRGPMALVTTPINSRIGTALTSRPRLARAAGLLQMRSRENRYGRDRDEAPLPRLKPAS